MPDSPSFTLRLTIAGTCALVPDDPFFKKKGSGKWKAGKPTSVTVLLPDMRAPRLADWEERTKADLGKVKEKFFSASHAPALLVSAFDVVSRDGFAVAGMCMDPTTLAPTLVHILDNEALTLVLDPEEPLAFAREIPPETQTLPTKKDRKSLWWLPRMAEISPEHEYGRAALLTLPAEDFAAEQLAARLEIPCGYLSIADFNYEGKFLCNFGRVTRDAQGNVQEPSSGFHWHRAIGNVLRCDIEIQATQVELQLEGKSSSSLTLEPRSPGGIVEVKLVNAELENLVLTPPSPPWNFPARPDPDFQAFYPLTTGKHTDPWPVPLNVGGPGGREKPCCMITLSGTK